MSRFWSKTYALAIFIHYCTTVYINVIGQLKAFLAPVPQACYSRFFFDSLALEREGQNLTNPPKTERRTQTEIKVSVLDENPKHTQHTITKKAKDELSKVVTKSSILTETTSITDAIENTHESDPVKEEYRITKAPEKGFFEIILLPVRQFIITLLSAEKVTSVLRNIAICIINGGMDLAAYYFPAPLLPMFATMISYLVPIEPVVTLRRKLPVSSYRKAINTAVNSFLKSFDKYKIVVDDEYDDPYMTKRFNRRFNIDSDEMTHKVAVSSATTNTIKN